jgi:hypothetical protein
MNKDNFEGGVRSAVGQGERFVGAEGPPHGHGLLG